MSTFKFFQAVITNRPIFLNGEYFYKGTKLGLAKYKDDLWIVAFSDVYFDVFSTDSLQGFIKTLRDQNNKPRPHSYKFRITGQEKQFKFKVLAGSTCPDGCCDCVGIEETFNSKEQATSRFSSLSKEFTAPCSFVRAYGPGYQDSLWIAPPSR
ncbi:MAG: hypothetical protein E6R04_01085 [Spirochaetes bacterium]|nr:MAG: hypothetical protein E6R04_01085 [Spirochaetota bacterium]